MNRLITQKNCTSLISSATSLYDLIRKPYLGTEAPETKPLNEKVRDYLSSRGWSTVHEISAGTGLCVRHVRESLSDLDTDVYPGSWPRLHKLRAKN